MALTNYTVRAMESLIKKGECRMLCYLEGSYLTLTKRKKIDMKMRSRIQSASRRVGMKITTTKIAEGGYIYIVGRKKVN